MVRSSHDFPSQLTSREYAITTCTQIMFCIQHLQLGNAKFRSKRSHTHLHSHTTSTPHTSFLCTACPHMHCQCALNHDISSFTTTARIHAKPIKGKGRRKKSHTHALFHPLLLLSRTRMTASRLKQQLISPFSRETPKRSRKASRCSASFVVASVRRPSVHQQEAEIAQSRHSIPSREIGLFRLQE